MLPDALTHRSWCAQAAAPVTFTGRLGDVLVSCPSCRALALGPGQKPAAHDDDKNGPQMIVPTLNLPQWARRSRWRCRDHDHPVDPRGRGCVQCVEARRRKPKTLGRLDRLES